MRLFSFASKKWLRTFGVFMCLFFFAQQGIAQTACPPNLDFETGAIAPWQCFRGSCCPIATTPSAPLLTRHTITTGAALDFYGGFPVVAPGGTFSFRLGNDNVGAEAEKVRYYVHVPTTPGKFVILYRFAVVFENPSHALSDQPRFEVNLYDSATGVSLPCGYISYVSSSGLPGFKISSKPGPVYYHEWDSATVNLSAYGGKTIMIDFSTGDCKLGGHFGYAYIDVNCMPTVSYIAVCDTTTPIILTAAPGFGAYTWYDSATFTTVYGTGSPLTLPNPRTLTTYAVAMAPYTGLGCADTMYVRVRPTALTLHPSNDTAICVGRSVLLNSGATDIVAPLTYSWSPSAGLACTSCSSTLATPAITTAYTVTVSNGYGCSKSAVIFVNVGPPVGATTGPGTVCVGSTIALTNSTSGGSWSSGSTVASVSPTGIVTGVTAGTEVISYSVTSACGTSVARHTVTVLPLPAPGVITGPTAICKSAVVTLSSSVGGGVWSSTTTSVSITAGGVVRGLSYGSAVISYTLTNTCGTAAATTTVTVDTFLVPGSITGLSTLCVGASITLSVPMGGGVWSSSSPCASVSPGGVVTGLFAGGAIIRYVVTNACGAVTVTHTVTVNNPPISLVSGPTRLCAGTTITMTGLPAGGTWGISGLAASITTGGVVTGLRTGTATVSYTVVAACGTAFDTAIVTVDTLPPPVTLSGPLVMCSTGSITLTSSFPGGVWSTAATCVAVGPGGVVTGVAAGTAIISYIITNSCGTSSASYTITVDAPPVAAISGPAAVCVGSAITLSGVSAGGTWGITGTAATITSAGVVSGITPGSSVVSYSVTNSCGTAVATATIIVNPLPDAGSISGVPKVCETDSVIMTSSLPGGIWSCTPNASISPSGVLKGVTAGTATITYRVSNVCGSDLTTATITINPMPSAGTLSGPSRACVGFSITLLSSVTGGVWSSSNAAIAPVSVSGVVSAVAAGVVNISYSVSNAYCTNHAIKNVTVYPQADPGIITGFSALCEGATITLSTSQPGGVWTTSNASVSVSSTGVVDGLTSGAVIVSYTVTNICGPQSVTKAVMVNPIPDVGNITGPHAVCVGASITLGGVSADGTGTWVSSNKGVASVNPKGVVLALSRGTSVITYTLTTVPGCKASAVHQIAVSPLPEVGSISGPSQLCAPMDMSFHQTRLGGIWTSSNTAVVAIDSLTGKAHAVGYGAVTITYTIAADGLGCTANALFPLAILSEAPFTIVETLTNISCSGKTDGSISVGATGGVGPWQYVWADGNTGSVIQKLPPGPYSVQVADVSSGCKASKNYRISEPDSIAAVSEVTDELCALANGAVSVTVKGGTPPYSFQWFDNSAGSRVTALPVGTYTVTIADINNCLKPLSAEVKDGGCNDIVVSEGLSPNGDGANDLWYIKGISVYTNNLVQLFDKWGDKVFEQRGYNNKWDGRGTNGSMLPDGTYFYVVKLNAQNGAGGKDVLTGSLLIKR